MIRVPGWLADLPPAVRWTLVGVATAVLAVVIGGGIWTWRERQEASAGHALATALTAAHQALATGQAAELEAAASTLEQFLRDHPRSRAAAQAWYVLGDVEFRRGRWDQAIAAFVKAARRASGSLAALSRLGQGYAYEAKGEPARALEAYQQGLTGRRPTDFLYGEFLLAKARAHEVANDSAAAITTYQLYLKDLPSADRADEVRMRLGLLGKAAG